jgi:DNA-cytosine methyltransferase
MKKTEKGGEVMIFNFISLCSGCGGLDLGLERGGMKCVGQVEIMPYALKVLKKHWPEIPKHTDIKTFNSFQFGKNVDLICFGFPCQNLSVAAGKKREGLKGQKSSIFWDCLRVVKDIRPNWVLIENVQGLLSSNNGNDFRIVLDSLQALGYIIDVDICDSQYFGVAQRRRRVFILCRHIKTIARKRSIISSAIIGQCITEILRSILIEAREASSIRSADLSYPKCLSVDGRTKKMNLFGITTKKDWQELFVSFIEALPLSPKELNSLGLLSGRHLKKELSQDIIKQAGKKTRNELLYGNTLRSWNDIWDENLKKGRKFTISTETSWITEQKIYSCAETLGIICKSIGHCKDWQTKCSNETLSILTGMKEFIDYARETNRSLFTPMEWVRKWKSFRKQAEQTMQSCFGLGNFCSSEVLFEQEGSGRTDPKKQARGQTRGLCLHDPTSETLIASTIQASDYRKVQHGQFGNEGNLIATTLQAEGHGRNSESQVIAHTIRAGERGVDGRVWDKTHIAQTDATRKGEIAGISAKLDTRRGIVLGNAVTMPVAKWIAERIIKWVKKEE